jgi:hypothetical protein
MNDRMRRPLLVLAALGVVVTLAVAWPQPGPERPKGTGVAPRGTPTPTAAPDTAADWKEVDRLIEQQKLAEASAKAEAILQRAIRSKDEDEWTRALVRCVQLRTRPARLRTAVRFLKEQPWPEGLLPRVTLELYYAHALAEYARAYSWEIGQRERVESPQGNSIDLKAMTREQILAEARRADLAVWARRQALSTLPVDRLAEYLGRTTIRRRCAGLCATRSRTSSSGSSRTPPCGRPNSRTASTGCPSPVSCGPTGDPARG